jgi:hypothetical protein
MSDSTHALSAEELDQQVAAELPERQAMSLISTDPSSSLLSGYGDAGGGFGLPDTTGDQTGATETASNTAGPATGFANDAVSTQTDASGSEGGSVTDVDRSEQYSQSDTATASS